MFYEIANGIVSVFMQTWLNDISLTITFFILQNIAPLLWETEYNEISILLSNDILSSVDF